MSVITLTLTHAVTQTIGGTASNEGGAQWYIFWGQLTASNTGTLTSVGINIQTASGTCMTSIYSDTGGDQPDNLLGNSIATTVGTGWNDLPITTNTVQIVSGTLYWLAYQCNTNGVAPYRGGPTTNVWYYGGAGYAWPIGGTGTNDGNNNPINQRMTYTVPYPSNVLIANPNPPLVTNAVITANSANQWAEVNTIISNGIVQYTGNWIWTPPNTLTSSSNVNTLTANIFSGGSWNSVLTVNAYSNTNVIFGFNGVNYYANVLGTNTVAGAWIFTGNYIDSTGNTLTTELGTNTITMDDSTSSTTSTSTSTTSTSTSATTTTGQTTYIGITTSGGDVFVWLVIAGIFLTLYIYSDKYGGKGKEGFLLKEVWLIACFSMILVALYGYYVITAVPVVTSFYPNGTANMINVTIKATRITTFDPESFIIGIVLVVLCFLFLWKALNDVYNMIRGAR